MLFLSQTPFLKSLKPYNVYNNLGYWFLLLIVLVATGFYQSYFKDFFEPKALLMHLHFALMAGWVLMLIAQPFLIKFKKLKWHRIIGKISYVWVPLVMISSYLMIRRGFISNIAPANALNNEASSSEKLINEAAGIAALPFMYFLCMGIFYTLAIVHKKRSATHSRYMLATALTLIGPTLDRTIVFNFDTVQFFGVVPVESLAFLVIDLILALLMIRDIRQQRNHHPLLISLLVFIAAQILYFTITDSKAWSQIISTILAM